MSDLSSTKDKAINAATIAAKLDKEGKHAEALPKYIESIEYFQHLIKCNS